jgi:hypothetical protein
MKNITIYDIKYLSEKTSPYFFTRDTLKFFHQRMSDFHIKKQSDGKYYIYAVMRDHTGRKIGLTERMFNPITNDLEFIEK